MQKLLKRINRIVMTLFLILLICMIVFVIFIRTSGEDGPEVFGYRTFNVLSDSMNPHLKTGDMIITKNVSPVDIETDDVIAFHRDGKIITHRVIQVETQGKEVSFMTQGDNNNVEDEGRVLDDDVIGKQVFTIPKGGYAANFISSPMGLFVFVVVPFTGYLFLELYERLKKVKSSEN